MHHVTGGSFPPRRPTASRNRVVRGNIWNELDAILLEYFQEVEPDAVDIDALDIEALDVFTAHNLPMPTMRYWERDIRQGVEQARGEDRAAFDMELIGIMNQGKRLPLRFVFRWRVPRTWRGEILALENAVVRLFLNDMQWSSNQYAGRCSQVYEADEGDAGGFDLTIQVGI